MPFTHLPFVSLDWTAGAHPLETKKLVEGQPVVLLEFAPGFEDPNWCERGHIIYVLDGVLDLVLDDRTERIAAGVASNKRGRIDALAWDADYLYLIEAKPKLDGAALGQIENYLRLLPQTAELQSLMGRTVRPIILCAIDDAAVHGEASARAIEVVVYHPAWWDAAQTKVQAQQAANVAQLEPGAPGTGRTSVRQNVGIVGGT